MKKKQKPTKPAYNVTLTFESYDEAREFAMKVMELPSAPWATGVVRVEENYPKGGLR